MKFSSNPIPEHQEVPLADDGRWENIVQHWTQQEEALRSGNGDKNSVYIVSVGRERDPLVREAQLVEIVKLVRAQGDAVVGQEIYYLTRPHPRTLIGKGASREIAERARMCEANMLVIDAELTPSQMRDLEDVAGIAICDREAVILNVFLRNANTRRAQVQVEIAQLEYLRPRIRGIGINMDQQMGGVTGSRGPGETASELMARKLDGRLAELNKLQKRLKRSDERQRQKRASCQRIVLVGYTNAGKTSLMNSLTDEKLSSRDMPFETLDTVSRALSRHGENVLISDTVGFIRRLPDHLLDSFESTLAEVREATLLLIVTDISDYEWQSQLKTTTELIEKLGAQSIPRFYVFNKVDLVSNHPTNGRLLDSSQGHPFLLISSLDQSAVRKLKEALLKAVRQQQETQAVFVPYSASQAMSMIYGKCRILETQSTGNGMHFSIQGSQQVISQIESLLRKARQ